MLRRTRYCAGSSLPPPESHPGRIILGGTVVFLRDSAACNYTLGTPLEVVYTERDGRKDVDKITRVRAAQ